MREFAVPTDHALGPPGAGGTPLPFTEGGLDHGGGAGTAGGTIYGRARGDSRDELGGGMRLFV